MKKLLSVLSVLMLFTATEKMAFANDNSLPENEQKETDQVIITLKDDASIQLKNSVAVANDPQGNDQLVSVEVPEDQTVDTYIDELEKHDDIQRVEPDYKVKLNYSPNDPDVSKSQYHHQKMETGLAWNKTRGSVDVIVAVIDNGIDVSHPELKSQIVRPFDTVKENSSIAVGEHGTHVAGIIGGSIDNSIGGAGVAPNTKIMPINVFSGEFAYTSEIIQGIYHAVEQGADIINLSLGNYAYSSAFNTAIQDAHKKGVIIVAAAGNERVENPYYPASYPNVISVGSSTASDKVSNFSNYGKHIDIAAPGSSIYSTLPKGAYGVMDGTSMAAPMVTGVAALIKSSEPALSNIEIEKRLYASADDLGVPGKDPFYGHGRVNARKALLINYLTVPSVNPVSSISASVTGKTVANAKVYAYAGTKKIGEAVAAKGSFTMPIAKQKPGTAIAVYAVDAARNKSASATVKVSDKTAPAIPTVNSVKDTALAITGKAESNAKVYAYVGKVKLGEAVAKSGAYSISIGKQKAGTSIAVYAVDAAKNNSAVKTVKVVAASKTTIAPKYSTTAPVNMRSGASTNHKVIVVIPKGKSVEYVKKSGSWYMVQYGSKTGWVYGSYLK
ncbi:MAG TPA: S8 family serine peptidase [Planococcus sp. (in: firmicutes)]|nr:S8 family serine peptidase [Planococcus sp. (in: firmicutes)]